MRFRIELDHEIVQGTHQGILAGRKFVQLWIFEIKVSLPHRALYVGNGVAHHAAESSLRFGRVNDLLDRSIHLSGIENCRVMAPSAPFGRLGADRILHVLDRLAIPLIIERRKMMRRAVPLLVNIFVTALAGI